MAMLFTRTQTYESSTRQQLDGLPSSTRHSAQTRRSTTWPVVFRPMHGNVQVPLRVHAIKQASEHAECTLCTMMHMMPSSHMPLAASKQRYNGRLL